VDQRQEVPVRLLDPEAGVLSEEVFCYVVSKEIWRSVRYRHFFSVCLLTVDSSASDLRSRGRAFVTALSKAVGEKIRGTDEIGFLVEGIGILLLNVADQPAVAVAERLCIHVGEVEIPSLPGREHLAVSVGGACFPRDGQTEAAILGHASRCLKAAQRRGGDRVVYDPNRP
jgi:GGDEF domain-containing protein